VFPANDTVRAELEDGGLAEGVGESPPVLGVRPRVDALALTGALAVCLTLVTVVAAVLTPNAGAAWAFTLTEGAAGTFTLTAGTLGALTLTAARGSIGEIPDSSTLSPEGVVTLVLSDVAAGFERRGRLTVDVLTLAPVSPAPNPSSGATNEDIIKPTVPRDNPTIDLREAI
jgi:hypothetical protein